MRGTGNPTRCPRPSRSGHAAPVGVTGFHRVDTIQGPVPSTTVSDDPSYDENAPLRRPAWVTWVALLVIAAMVLTAASALL